MSCLSKNKSEKHSVHRSLFLLAAASFLVALASGCSDSTSPNDEGDPLSSETELSSGDDLSSGNDLSSAGEISSEGQSSSSQPGLSSSSGAEEVRAAQNEFFEISCEEPAFDEGALQIYCDATNLSEESVYVGVKQRNPEAFPTEDEYSYNGVSLCFWMGCLPSAESWELDAPLAPGESGELHFTVEVGAEGVNALLNLSLAQLSVTVETDEWGNETPTFTGEVAETVLNFSVQASYQP